MALIYVLLCIMIGVIVDRIILKLSKKTQEVHGYIDMDHETGLCRVRLDGIITKAKNIAILKIDHTADLSREEQTL